MEKYGIGLIGLGMGKSLLALNSQSEIGLEVRGVCSGNLENAVHFQHDYKLKYATDDYRELLNKEDIGIIAVYSPDHLHAEHSIAALQAGKHVICTKPLATRVEDAETIVHLAEKKKLKFLLGQTMRFEPQFSTLKKMYDDGDFGRILLAESHYVHDMRPVFTETPWRLKSPKDFLYGAVCHPLDILYWFLGEVEEVFAYGDRGGLTKEYPIMDNFLLNLKFKNGIIGRSMGAFDIVHPPMPMMGVSLFGDKGSAVGGFTDKKEGYVNFVIDKFDNKEEARMNFSAEVDGPYGHGGTVLKYLRHFDQCLRGGLNPVPDARDGKHIVKICAAAWDSIKTGQPIRIET